MLALTLSGVADIAYLGPAYISDKLPLSQVAELPGSFTTSCEGTMAYWKLAKDGILAQREYQPNGVRVLFAYVFAPYQIYLATKRFQGIEDLRGLKLRSTGGPMDLMVQALKGVPVRMSAPEVYESLSRGTVDGAVFPLSALLDYKLDPLVKSATVEENFGSFIAAYAISDKLWKKLPAEVQKAMVDAGEETTKRTCAMADRDIAPNLQRLEKQGVTLVKLSADDKQKLKVLLAPIANDWAQGLDRRGKPGTQVLEAFQAALREAK